MSRPAESPGAALRVGHFSSIPWIPLYAGSGDWPVQRVQCVSSGVRDLAERGRLDITPMATADWFDLHERWRRLAPWGLAYRQQAGSVLLFSQRPIEALDAADLAICGETTTSVRVLHALLTGRYGLRVGTWRRGVDPGDSETPRLLIQDQALEEAGRRRFRHVYDVGREWWAWQRTPIISALWVARSDLPAAETAQFEQYLHAAYRRYEADPVGTIAAHRRQFGWPAATGTVTALLANFEYRLGDEAERGIEVMRTLLPARLPQLAA